jgi:hypothetical protein
VPAYFSGLLPAVQGEFPVARSSDEEHRLYYRFSDHLFEASSEASPRAADSTCDRRAKLGQGHVLHATVLDSRIGPGMPTSAIEHVERVPQTDRTV